MSKKNTRTLKLTFLAATVAVVLLVLTFGVLCSNTAWAEDEHFGQLVNGSSYSYSVANSGTKTSQTVNTNQTHGSVGNPFVISTVNQWMDFVSLTNSTEATTRQTYNNENVVYVLGSNLTFASENIQPACAEGFVGKFYGQGFTVSGGCFDSDVHDPTHITTLGGQTVESVGLFAKISGGTVADLCIGHVAISAGTDNVAIGCIAGYACNATIVNCASTYGTDILQVGASNNKLGVGGVFVGGFVGAAEGDMTFVRNSFTGALAVSNTESSGCQAGLQIGGFVGHIGNGGVDSTIKFQSCYADFNLKAIATATENSGAAGGTFVGYAYSSSNQMSVEYTDCVGYIDYNSSSYVNSCSVFTTGCCNDVAISMTNCYFDGNVPFVFNDGTNATVSYSDVTATACNVSALQNGGASTTATLPTDTGLSVSAYSTANSSALKTAATSAASSGDISGLTVIGSNITTQNAPGNTYSISYQLGIGATWTQLASAPKSFTCSANAQAITELGTAPTRPGYTFQGWFTDAEYTNQVTDFDAAITATQSTNLTFYAKWTFNLPEASPDGTKNEVYFGTDAELIVTLTHAGFGTSDVTLYTSGTFTKSDDTTVNLGWFKKVGDIGDNWVAVTSTTGDHAITVTTSNSGEFIGGKLKFTKPEVSANGTDYRFVWVVSTSDTECEQYADFTLYVHKLKLQVPQAPAASDLIYNGEVQTCITAESPYISLSGHQKKNAGSYTATAELTDKINCQWEDGSTDDCDIPFTISRKAVAYPVATVNPCYKDKLENGSYVGVEQAAPFTIDTSSVNEVSGCRGTNVGSYTAVYALKDNTNYKWIGTENNTDQQSYQWQIMKQIVNLPVLPVTSVVYKGSEYEMAYNAGDASRITLVAGSNKGTNVGNYTAQFTLPDTNNYCWKGNPSTEVYEINWEITKATATIPTLANTSGKLTYNGSTQTMVTAAAGSEDLYTITGTAAAKDANSYSVTVTLNNPQNYKWNKTVQQGMTIPNESGAITINWTMEKATVTIPQINGSTLTYNGNAQTKVSAATGTADKITITNGSGTDAQTYYASVTLNDNKNYKWSALSATGMTIAGESGEIVIEWEIQKAIATLPVLTAGNFNYDGQVHDKLKVASGFEGVYTVTGGSATDAGNYTARASFTNTNYKWSTSSQSGMTFTNGVNGDITVSWSIAKANINLTAPTQNSDLAIYAGQTLSQLSFGVSGNFEGGSARSAVTSATIGGTWSWKNSSTVLTASSNSAVAVFTPTVGASNYNAAETTVSFTVSQLTVTVWEVYPNSTPKTRHSYNVNYGGNFNFATDITGLNATYQSGYKKGYYSNESCTVKITGTSFSNITENKVIYLKYESDSNTKYTVYHVFQVPGNDGTKGTLATATQIEYLEDHSSQWSFTQEQITEQLWLDLYVERIFDKGVTGAPANAALSSKPGYTFKESITFTDNKDNEVTVTSDSRDKVIAGDGSTKIYLFYELDTYTITWSAPGATFFDGSRPTVPNVFYGAVVGVSGCEITLPNAQKVGFVFVDWYTSPDFSRDSLVDFRSKHTSETNSLGQSFPTTYEVTGNVTFYAKYTANTYYIDYNNNGSSSIAEAVTRAGGNVADFPITVSGNPTSFTYDDLATLTFANPSAPGFVFLGWAWIKDENNLVTGITKAMFDDVATDQENDTVQLIAKWGLASFTMVYDANGGSFKSGAVTSKSVENMKMYNQNGALLDDEKVSRDGYEFDGWYILENGNKKLIYDTSYICLAAATNTSFTVYANWKPGSRSWSWEVNCDADLTDTYYSDKTLLSCTAENQGSAIETGDQILGESELILTISPRAGFKVKQIKFGTDTVSGNDTNVYSYTVPVGSNKLVVVCTLTPVVFTIDYNLNGGVRIDSTAFKTTYTVATAKASTPNLPGSTHLQKTGYSFLNWRYDDNGVEKPLSNLNNLTTPKNLVLKANWAPIQQTVTLFNNNGSGNTVIMNTDTGPVETETVLTLENPIWNKYLIFVGWARTQNGAAEIFPDKQGPGGVCTFTVGVDEAANTLYGVWQTVDVDTLNTNLTNNNSAYDPFGDGVTLEVSPVVQFDGSRFTDEDDEIVLTYDIYRLPEDYLSDSVWTQSTEGLSGGFNGRYTGTQFPQKVYNYAGGVWKKIEVYSSSYADGVVMMTLYDVTYKSSAYLKESRTFKIVPTTQNGSTGLWNTQIIDEQKEVIANYNATFHFKNVADSGLYICLFNAQGPVNVDINERTGQKVFNVSILPAPLNLTFASNTAGYNAQTPNFAFRLPDSTTIAPVNNILTFPDGSRLRVTYTFKNASDQVVTEMKNVGSYKVTAHFEWVENDGASASFVKPNDITTNFTISPVEITSVNFTLQWRNADVDGSPWQDVSESNYSVVYRYNQPCSVEFGMAVTADNIFGVDSSNVVFVLTQSGNNRWKATNVGSYTAVVTGISGSASGNYTLNLTKNSQAWEITRATKDMSGVTFKGLTTTYDGASHTLAIEGDLPEGVSVHYTVSSHTVFNSNLSEDLLYLVQGNTCGGATAAGSYVILASFTIDDSANYNAITAKTATLIIRQAKYEFSDAELNYTEGAQNYNAMMTKSAGERTFTKKEAYVSGVNYKPDMSLNSSRFSWTTDYYQKSGTDYNSVTIGSGWNSVGNYKVVSHISFVDEEYKNNYTVEDVTLLLEITAGAFDSIRIAYNPSQSYIYYDNFDWRDIKLYVKYATNFEEELPYTQFVFTKADGSPFNGRLDSQGTFTVRATLTMDDTTRSNTFNITVGKATYSQGTVGVDTTGSDWTKSGSDWTHTSVYSGSAFLPAVLGAGTGYGFTGVDGKTPNISVKWEYAPKSGGEFATLSDGLTNVGEYRVRLSFVVNDANYNDISYQQVVYVKINPFDFTTASNLVLWQYSTDNGANWQTIPSDDAFTYSGKDYKLQVLYTDVNGSTHNANLSLDGGAVAQSVSVKNVKSGGYSLVATITDTNYTFGASGLSKTITVNPYQVDLQWVVVVSGTATPLTSLGFNGEDQLGTIRVRYKDVNSNTVEITNIHVENGTELKNKGTYTLFVDDLADTNYTVKNASQKSRTVVVGKYTIDENYAVTWQYSTDNGATWNSFTDASGDLQLPYIGGIYKLRISFNGMATEALQVFTAMIVSSDGQDVRNARNSGTATKSYTLVVDSNEAFENYMFGEDFGKTLTVASHALTVDWNYNSPFTYNGNLQAPVPTAYGVGDESAVNLLQQVEKHKDCAAEKYQSTAVLKSEYQNNYVISVNPTCLWEILPITLTLSWNNNGGTLTDGVVTYTYSGSEQKPTVTVSGNLSADGTVSQTKLYRKNGADWTEASLAKDAGDYKVVVSISNSNYTAAASSLEKLFTINKANPVVNNVRYTEYQENKTYQNNSTGLRAEKLVCDTSAAGYVNGTFTFTDASGALSAVGSKQVGWLFTPNDTNNYNTASGTLTLDVLAQTPSYLTVTNGQIAANYSFGEVISTQGVSVELMYASYYEEGSNAYGNKQALNSSEYEIKVGTKNANGYFVTQDDLAQGSIDIVVNAASYSISKTITVSVVAVPVSNLVIDNQSILPTQVYISQQVDLSNLQFVITYSNGKVTAPIKVSEWDSLNIICNDNNASYSGNKYVFNTVGEKTITFSYAGKTASAKINVIANTLNLVFPDRVLEYRDGAPITIEGAKVQNQDGSTSPLPAGVNCKLSIKNTGEEITTLTAEGVYYVLASFVFDYSVNPDLKTYLVPDTLEAQITISGLSFKMDVTAPEASVVYTGNRIAHEAISFTVYAKHIDTTEDWFTITYTKVNVVYAITDEGGSPVSEIVNAGRYNVSVTLYFTASGTAGTISQSDSYTIEVTPAQATVTLSMGSWTFGETPATPVVSTNFGTVVLTYLVGGEYVAFDSTVAATIPIGSYKLKATVATTPNYNGDEKIVDFTVKSPVRYEFEPVHPSNRMSYTGSVIDVSLESYKVFAVRGEGNNQTRSEVTDILGISYEITREGAAVAAAKDAGTYKVVATVSFTADNNATESLSDTYTVVVLKATAQISLSIQDWTFGQTPSTPVCSSTFGEVVLTCLVGGSYKEATAELLASLPIGQYTLKASVANDVNNNYDGAESTVQFWVSAPVTYTLSVVQNVESAVYTGKAIDHKVSSYTITAVVAEGPLAGSTQVTPQWSEVAYTLGGQPLTALVDAGNHEITVTVSFKIAGSTETHTASTTYNVEITRAQVELTVSMGSWIRGELSATPTSTTNFGTVRYYYLSGGVYKPFDQSEVAGLPVGTYKLKAVVEDTDNFKGAEAVTEFTVNAVAIHKLQVNPVCASTVYDGNVVDHKASDYAVYSVVEEGPNQGATKLDLVISTIEYVIYRNGEMVTEIVNAGTYTVSATVSYVSTLSSATRKLVNEYTVVVAPAQAVVTVSIDNWTRGEIPASPTSTTNFGTVTYQYLSNRGYLEFNDDAAAKLAVGTYKLRATVADDPQNNYKGGEATTEFTVNAPVNYSLIATPSVEAVTYNGSAVNFNVSDYALYAVVSEGANPSTTRVYPQMCNITYKVTKDDMTVGSIVNAGTYKVVVTAQFVLVDGAPTRSATDEYTVTVAPAQAAVTVSMDNWVRGEMPAVPAATTTYGTVNCYYLSEIGYVAFTDEVAMRLPVGTYKLKAVVLDDTNGNFIGNEAVTDFTVIAPTNYVLNISAASERFVYTGDPVDYKLKDYSVFAVVNEGPNQGATKILPQMSNVAYTITQNGRTVNSIVNAGTYQVTAYVEFVLPTTSETKRVSADFTVIVAQANVEITLSIDNWVQGGLPAVPTSTSNFGTVSYMYASSGDYMPFNNTTALKLTAGTYTLKAVVEDDFKGNYRGGEVTVTFDVMGKEISVSNAAGEALGSVEVQGAGGFAPDVLLNVDDMAAAQLKEIKVDNQEVLSGYEIYLTSSNGVVTWNGQKAKVKLLIGSEYRNKGYLKVYYIDEYGNAVDVRATRSGNYMVFETTHFSSYVLTTSGSKTGETTPGNEPSMAISATISGVIGAVAGALFGAAVGAIVVAVVLKKKNY